LKSGGFYVTHRPGTVYWGFDAGGYNGKGFNGGVFEPQVSEYDHEYKVILKNGEPYLVKQALTGVLVLPMFPDEDEKTFHYGSMEYLGKLAQEVEPDDTFNNGKSYEDTMEDLFNNPVPAW